MLNFNFSRARFDPAELAVMAHRVSCFREANAHIEFSSALAAVCPLGSRSAWSLIDPHGKPDKTEFPRIGRATSRRCAEFATGRRLARTLLSQIGIDDAIIHSRTDRSPAWPEGAIGSISHSGDLCAVAVMLARPGRSLGLDIERIGRVSRRALRVACTQSEIALVDALPVDDRPWVSTALFSMKEAIYKAWYPLGVRDLSFADIELSMAASAPFSAELSIRLSFLNSLLARSTIAVATVSDHILTSAFVENVPVRSASRLGGAFAGIITDGPGLPTFQEELAVEDEGAPK